MSGRFSIWLSLEKMQFKILKIYCSLQVQECRIEFDSGNNKMYSSCSSLIESMGLHLISWSFVYKNLPRIM